MGRPKSPCGTYPAYQRHLREHTAVDAACRRAQQDHDANKGRKSWRRAVAPAPVAQLPTVDVLAQLDAARDLFAASAGDLAALSRDDDLYGVIDLYHAMGELLEAWCGAADDVERANGYANLTPELRAFLLDAGGEQNG